MSGGRVLVTEGKQLVAEDEIRGMLDGGWNIGRSLNVAISAGTRSESQPLLEAKASDEVASPMTVTLFTRNQVGTITDAVATVGWGTGGVQADAEVDFVNGTVFSVHASFIRITASIRTTIGTPSIDLAAMICYGIHPGGLRPQRTISRDVNDANLGDIAVAGVSVASNIPTFAHNVQLMQAPAAAVAEGAYRLRFFGGVAAVQTFDSLTNSAFGRKAGGPAPIPNMARTITVRNLDAVVALSNIQLLYSLCL